jgi:arylsulfatase A
MIAKTVPRPASSTTLATVWRSPFVRALAAVALFVVTVEARAAAPVRPPNIVLILMDDMGWRDVGFMGNTFVETPRLDALARRGLVFRQAYASAPNCAPTRACLISGKYTPRHGVYTVVDPRQPPGSPWHKLQAADSKAELATEFVTVAESLRERGYATAFFGMWNLGRGRSGPVTPGGQGFQKVVFPENLGFGKDAYFDDDGKYLSDRLTDAALEFMESNRDHPFFAYIPDHAVHAPFEPPAELLEKYPRKGKGSSGARDKAALAATVEAVDRNVGRIVDALERWGLTDNTWIVFTSDNGGTKDFTAPLRGGKGELYEGGVRVPLVIAGPGLVRPGRETDIPAASIDLYPTFLEWSGRPATPDLQLDGASLAPVARGDSLPERSLFWHFPCYVGRATPSSAIRQGRFKLIQFFEDGGRRELYDLSTDPGEERDLFAARPDISRKLASELTDWQKSTGATIPDQPNPKYDPNAARPGGRRNQR